MKYFIAFGFLFFVLDVIQAQDYSNTDLQNIDVGTLSEAQISQFIQQAQASGFSQTELEAMARQRGMSEGQISQLRARILDVDPSLAGQAGEAIEAKTSRLRMDPLGALLMDLNDFTLLDFIESEQKTFGVFGLEMFELESGDAGFQSILNVPTPKNYILGAGDELIIDIYGASEITYQLEVSPEGQILISGIGPIKVGGLSVEVARAKVFKRLTNIYSGLAGSNPNTFAQVSVGNIRTIKVNIVGHVNRPGTYTLNSFASILNALYVAGGPTEKGSLRSIRLLRDGDQIATFDVYQYLFDPSVGPSVILQDGDQVVIDPYINYVSLTGAVKNPAKFELAEGETFEDLFRYTGGFEGNAYTESLIVERKNGWGKSILTINPDNYGKEKVQNGDSINVGKIIDRFDNRVSIDGAVMRPGDYQLTEGMMLSDLIGTAQGLREDAFKGRGNIFRQNEDLTLKNISFNLEEIIKGSQDILLKTEDLVAITSIFDLRRELTVKVEGEVGLPGTYPFMEEMTVEDLLNMSGGFKESANKSVVEVARQIRYDQEEVGKSAEIFTFQIDENLTLSEKASTFVLKPFDVVLIKRSSFYQEQKLIKIEGEVLFPGYYALETRDEKVSDLIKRAGGLTQYAYPKGATILRRTEFYEPDASDSISFFEGNLDAGRLRSNRLRELQKTSREEAGFSDNEDNTAVDSEASEFRSNRLKQLQQRDTKNKIDLLGQIENIGINLGEALEAPGSKYDLILKDGDVISVPRELQTLRVRGNVLYPNTIRYEPGMSFKRTISKAGGFADDALARKSYVIYANGSAQRTKNILFFKKYPKIEPGAEIIVPQRIRERSPLNIQQVLGITSSLVTIIVLVNEINSNN